ncbi:PAS domain S-box protein [Lysobacter sp. MMG2]|uniref:PAS domain-containing sensor histidine kinase n=1 Tax=Lysobacter sp. MMG2 TaxID=2801338 RepID=UPI001C22E8ED|nr:ATP-binding protein [Lysobacter sp. MMG2]MBU8974561.1 PAS domain S-box protein [Lysobacter sp. MMG2]
MSSTLRPHRPSALSRAGHPVPAERRLRLVLRLSAAVLMLAIFALDTFTTLEGAVAVLYVVAVLLVARTYRRGDIVIAAVGTAALTLVAYVDMHGTAPFGAQTVRAFVSLAAIGIAAVLALQNQSAMRTLSDQAMLLDLSHDMIFVRDVSGRITSWNRTAQEVYGWPPEDAVGRRADELLKTRYPGPREAVESELLDTGRWEGTLEQTTRSGSTLVLDSRWVLQRDRAGRPVAVMETHTDVTERKAAYAALVRSERRYRRMFDASRIGVVEQDWSAVRAELDALDLQDAAAIEAHAAAHPQFIRQARRLARIRDVNPAFAAMLGAVGTAYPASVDDLLGESDRTFGEALAAFARGDAFHEGESEIIGADGRRVPVLFAITFPSPEDGDANVLVFVIDNTERRQAQDALFTAQTELAHAARVSTLGELTASIAHEVNQPLMAVVTNGEAGMRWLRRETPDLPEVESAIARIISEGRRAAEIVHRIRAFLAKVPVQRQRMEVASVVEEAARLVQHELARERVKLRVDIAAHLPAVDGDRVQLQQVLVNLMVNAGQAMASQPAPRMVTLTAAPASDGQVAIRVHDTGPGIAAEHLARLFDPFFTTRPQGMGMGLAISRTIAEAHGGRLHVESEPGHGAAFTLLLPTARPDATT